MMTRKFLGGGRPKLIVKFKRVVTVRTGHTHRKGFYGELLFDSAGDPVIDYVDKDELREIEYDLEVMRLEGVRFYMIPSALYGGDTLYCCSLTFYSSGDLRIMFEDERRAEHAKDRLRRYMEKQDQRKEDGEFLWVDGESLHWEEAYAGWEDDGEIHAPVSFIFEEREEEEEK